MNLVREGKATVTLGTPAPPAPKGPTPKGPIPKGGPSTVVVPGAGGPGGDVAFYQDVFWALLNTSEFMINH